ncbi:MAG: hypothetical protein K6C05_07075 [Anaerovibrio sp.]|uniref:hypothetical protein n=1 Tax=Anaerovibrio sp. TaxID=1872532 RepID=UPI0025E6FA9F|nr:hypothetical protein [Anaerovibrio sp.]MCR5176601.1 hypothetical protein [Anaerovibrio sp.]
MIKLSVTKLASGVDGALLCPECNGSLVYKDGGQVRVVNGRVDYENIKPRYVCFHCKKFYREMLHSGYYDVFELDDELKKEAEALAGPVNQKPEPSKEDPVCTLSKDSSGAYVCPRCGKPLRYSDGSAIQVVNGKVDYESVKARYICDDCGIFYRELLNSGMYEVFQLEQEQPRQSVADNIINKDVSPVVALSKNSSGRYKCPVCNGELEFSDGGQVRVVNGKVDYENVKARYICRRCETFYRELLNSGLYEVFDLDDLYMTPEKKKIVGTGDLAPMQLKLDANGKCACPRCGANMRYLEPEAVRIVDGVADMRDTVARFACDECSSIYRRIASTDYYQWSES